MSVTNTVKVTVPAAAGVPLMEIVPAPAFTVNALGVRPVVPPRKSITVKVVNGLVPPLTEMI